MQSMGDKSVDCVLTDPPYGLGKRNTGGGRNTLQDIKWDIVNHDLVSLAVSLGKKAIVWGGNYYSLPPSRCWLIWYKRDAVPSAADCEIAWTSEDRNSLVFDWTIAATNKERVDHPTQKPLALMRWCLINFTNQGDLIFDPFMGSGTTGVACIQTGRNFIGCEIDENYFKIAKRRIEIAQMQPNLFY
jgi:site-specific DNA-methyltransferase (adenine-specific)/modification methylase